MVELVYKFNEKYYHKVRFNFFGTQPYLYLNLYIILLLYIIYIWTPTPIILSRSQCTCGLKRQMKALLMVVKRSETRHCLSKEIINNSFNNLTQI